MYVYEKKKKKTNFFPFFFSSRKYIIMNFVIFYVKYMYSILNSITKDYGTREALKNPQLLRPCKKESNKSSRNESLEYPTRRYYCTDHHLIVVVLFNPWVGKWKPRGATYSSEIFQSNTNTKRKKNAKIKMRKKKKRPTVMKCNTQA